MSLLYNRLARFDRPFNAQMIPRNRYRSELALREREKERYIPAISINRTTANLVAHTVKSTRQTY